MHGISISAGAQHVATWRVGGSFYYVAMGDVLPDTTPTTTKGTTFKARVATASHRGGP